MKKIIGFCFLVNFALAVQVNEIKFSGLTQLSAQSALDISGLKAPQNISEKEINKAILNLYKQNYFSDIQAQLNNGVLEFKLKQKQSIARIDITGVASNDRKQIDSILNIKRGYLYDEGSVKEAAERIRMFYEAKGYFDTVVETSTEPLSNASGLQLNFIINRGENITIENVLLSGSKKLDYGDVEPSIANKEREFMGWMWGRNDGALKIFELGNDSARISDEYMKRGYLDAKVSSAFLRTDTNNYKADLSYFVEEGISYKIAAIRIENPVFSEEENTEQVDDLKSQVGKTANIEKIRQDITLIQTATADLGYAFAQVYPDIQKNELDAEVSIVFKVIPNEKVYIRNVIISGNSRTADKVVRRELYLTEGNLYHKSDLIESNNALRRTSYFDDVNIKEQRVDATQLDLIVEVTEASTGSISGGIGYGSTDGLLLNASLSDTNIFGTGLKSVISVDKSDDYLSGRIGLTNPRLFDTYYSLGGSVYANEYDWDTYSEKSRGFDITLGRQFFRYFNASLTYNYEADNIYYLSPTLLLSGYELGRSVKSSVTPAISFNNTDDYYLPRRGIIASTALEVAGVGGTQNFVASSTRFNFYQGLQDYIGLDLIYRYKGAFYKIWDTGKLPINQRIYLGGISSIRGFESRTVSPKNRYGYEEGGTIAYTNSFELSFPIIDRIKLRGALFFDYGAVGRSVLDIDKSIHRYSTGMAIEWITPIGPLQLVFARALNDKPGDDTNNFEFTLGTRF
ncbi:outer membrane protein assembly factor BamA [Campylobacter sp. MIT 12-8780]|uniref:outer membrane protein assembly factor BamA n=1 Tax=unclassified Campylobacter TaxID=2593542 RepID=UPI00115D6020|nr:MULTISPECIES: outer membrane protein assembly factor BamA [unclassified Campylobacter]NDJ27321.1 outer membrane protein assembly factor BamA [Campylobacter sp. MIT 19-121]TQR40352.1 outer membrane protein assembly factor BamA [Campylobacter sp. MIT 12-8780]